MQTGGVTVRRQYVSLLKKSGFEVVVITVNYWDEKYKEEYIDGIKVVYLPYKMNLRINMFLERIGVLEDYLDTWCDRVLSLLRGLVKGKDIIFTTSGGELASIKVGSILKREFGCKFVVNLHDPVDYTKVNGLLINTKFHVSRESSEARYVGNADLVITSSLVQKKSLISKKVVCENKVINGYFGYVDTCELFSGKEKLRNSLKVVYGGNFGVLQKPEILAEATAETEDVEIYYVGNYFKYKPLRKYIGKSNIHFIDYLPYNEYSRFVSQEMDCGFVSLGDAYLGACVPSKIYEYINFGVPIIGRLPEGDAKNIVNDNGYGFIGSNLSDILVAIRRMKDSDIYNACRNRVIQDRSSWQMSVLIKPVIKVLESL